MMKPSPRTPRPRAAGRLVVERLEDRTLPALLAPLTNFSPALPPSDSAGGAAQALNSADGRFTVYTSTAANLVPGQVDTAVASNVFLYDRQTGTTTLVSHTPGSATTGADGNSDFPRISSDGSFVVYESSAGNLVAGQAGARGQENVFLFDAVHGTNTLVSHQFQSLTTAANAPSLTFYTTGFGFGPSTGQFLLFSSSATDLIPGQGGPGVLNLFLYDNRPGPAHGTLTLVSHTFGDPQTGADDATEQADLTPDGSAVVFESFATDVVSGQNPQNKNNIFLYDTLSDTSRLISGAFDPAAGGNSATDAAGFSFQPLISADGRLVSYVSDATDLVAGQTSSGGTATRNVFSYDTTLGQTTLVSGIAGPATFTQTNSNPQVVPPVGTGGHGPPGPPIGSTFDTDDTTFSTINFAGVPANQTVTDVTVSFNIQHTFDGDLLIDLIAPDGTVVELVPPTGNPGQNFINTTFNDAGTTTIDVGGQAPYTGTFRPETPFSALFGKQVNGTWTLAIDDTTAGDTGFLQNWTLSLSATAGPPSVTGNGNSTEQVLSSDGSTIAFLSGATNLVPGQGNAVGNVFVYDTASGALALASHVSGAPTTAAGGVATNTTGTFDDLSLSADGRFLAYQSRAANLAPGQPGPSGNANVFLHDGQFNLNTLVSQSFGPTPAAGDRNSFYSHVSADGSTVAFLSLATNLAPGVTVADGGQNLYLYGVGSGLAPAVASRSAFQATATSLVYGTSADGRFVVFTSNAPDVIPGQVDTNADQDVFLLDRDTGTITLVSHVPSSPLTTGDHGSPTLLAGGLAPSVAPVISADGNWVAFVSQATNLVAGETGEVGFNQVYLFNRLDGTVRLVSHSSVSLTAVSDSDASTPVLSAHGESVAYASHSSDLIPGLVEPASGILVSNVYVYSSAGGANTLVSHAAGSPTVGSENPSFGPVISADGRFVAYQSESTALVAGADISPTDNVFLYDNSTGHPTSGQNALVSHVAGDPTTSPTAGSTTPVVSDDGSTVAFVSAATDLVPGQDATPFTNVFLYSVANGAIRLASGVGGSTTQPAGGYSDTPVLSSDGSRVAFRSDAPDLVAGQVNTPGATSNVFLFDAPTGAMTLVSHAAGSLTTTAAGSSSAPSIDAAGDLVVYLSTATNLVAGQQGGGVNNVFLYAVDLAAGGLPDNALLSGQGGSPVLAGTDPAFLALISRDPVVAFNVLSGGGGASVAFLNKLVELILSSSSVPDGSPPGTVVGTVSVSSALAGQFLPPKYKLPGAEADNASFALGATSQGRAPLVINVPVSAANRAGYQVSLHVNIGLGDSSALFVVSVGAPGSGGGVSARLVRAKVRKKVRLMVQVYSLTGVLLRTFASPFQKPAYKAITVSVLDTTGDGVPDEVVVTARKGKRRVRATFPG
jgi:Tol biopolymer transport system component